MGERRCVSVNVTCLCGTHFWGMERHKELGKLPELEMIWLQDNEVEGPIPQELGKLQRLRVLRLGNNRLSGQIPKAKGWFERLMWIWVEDGFGGSFCIAEMSRCPCFGVFGDPFGRNWGTQWPWSLWI